jgi:hypothetical protein
MIDSGISASSIPTSDGVGSIAFADLTILASDLAASGSAYIVPAISGRSYKLRNMMVNKSTGMSGGGGNRNIILQDGSGILVEITAALSQTPINTLWGSTGLVFSTGVPQNVTTLVGQGLFFTYFGGTADYTTGSIDVTLEYQRIS